MLHDIPLQWLLWCIWSVYPAGRNPSERRCGVKGTDERERKRNRLGRVNRKLQSLEGQQDVPYLEAALIKDLGWGNVIIRSWAEWTEIEIKQNRKWWMQWNTEKKNGAWTCYIISYFSCFCCPPQWNLVGVVDSYLFVQFIKPLIQDTTDGKEALVGYYFNWITVVSYLLHSFYHSFIFCLYPIFCWSQAGLFYYFTVKSRTHLSLIRGLRGLQHSWPSFMVSFPAAAFLANKDGEPSMLLCHLFFPPSPQRSRLVSCYSGPLCWCLLLNIHIHKVVSLLFCCDRVNGPWLSPERSRYKSHWLRKTGRVRVWVCVYMHVSLVSSLRVTKGYEEHSFCPLDPGNANGLAKRSAGKWGIEERFHSLSSLSTYISPLHFPFHEKACLWMLVISI